MDNTAGARNGGSAVLGVRFQEAGKIYYFEAGGYHDLEVGSFVVVETSRGVELGRVVIAPGQVLSAELTEPLKPIIRLGTPDDLDERDRLEARAAEATALARERARALNLPMKIVSSQYTLDGARLTVFFTAEGRVDFRELIRDLAHQLPAQVQLRQVGPRDQAKLIGGYGRCGRRLCCSSWLTAFPSISIKMAKEQNLPLNPSKISGQCGRLLCCLSYENDVYKQLKAELPRPDSWVSTPAGSARVISVNAVKQLVTLQMQDLRMVEMTVAQLGLERGVVRPLPGGPGSDASEDAEASDDVIEEFISIGVVVQETIVRRNGASQPPAGQGEIGAQAGGVRPQPNGRGPQQAQGRGDGRQNRSGGQPRVEQAERTAPDRSPTPPVQAAATQAAGQNAARTEPKRRRRRHRGGNKGG